jgi:hypothetical protein
MTALDSILRRATMPRKLTAFLSLVAIMALATLCLERRADARLNGANTATTVSQPDIWCQGGTNQGTSNTATEVCQDYNGHLVPTTTGVQKLGTSSLKWLDIETANINQGGAAAAFGGQAVLLTQTTSQLLNVTTAPSAVGATVFVKWLAADGSASGYGICSATSTTVQGGTGADSDWVWISTGNVAGSNKVGSPCK